ncbi:MAG: hypothetical protein ABSE77_23260, partial [Acidimicrobiales bacterium]
MHRLGRHWARSGRPGRRWVPVVAVLALGAGACGATKTPPSAKPHPAKPGVAKRVVTASGASSCVSSQWASTVTGTPDISTIPAIEAVTVTPNFGGLLVSLKFKKPFVSAPEGVYDAWTVFLFQHRNQAANVDNAVQLQIEDRGVGWEPSGWTLLATFGSNNNEVAGNIHTNKARNLLQTFFPAGFANLDPPFYWFAEQEEFRAYLPRPSKTDHQDFSVNGTITSGCP